MSKSEDLSFYSLCLVENKKVFFLKPIPSVNALSLCFHRVKAKDKASARAIAIEQHKDSKNKVMGLAEHLCKKNSDANKTAYAKSVDTPKKDPFSTVEKKKKPAGVKKKKPADVKKKELTGVEKKKKKKTTTTTSGSVKKMSDLEQRLALLEQLMPGNALK